MEPEKKPIDEIDMEKIKVLLDELIGLLKDDDFDATGKVDEILEISGDFSILEFKKIKKSVEDYDFEKALELTNKLITDI